MEKFRKNPNEGVAERASRILRNLNTIGAVAFIGAGVAIGSELLAGYGAFNAAQAVFFEATRRLASGRGREKIGEKPA